MFFPASDGTEFDSADWARWLLVLSHLPLVPVAWYLFSEGLFYLGAVALSVLVDSGVYHMCRAQFYCFGLGPGLDKARLLDHITSIHAGVAVALVALLSDSGGGKRAVAARVLAPFVVFFAELAFPFQTQVFVGVTAFVVLVAADHLLVERTGRLPRADRYQWPLLLAGTLVAAVGLVLYALDFHDSTAYATLHTLWHLAITAAYVLVGRGLVDGRTRSAVVPCCRPRRRRRRCHGWTQEEEEAEAEEETLGEGE